MTYLEPIENPTCIIKCWNVMYIKIKSFEDVTTKPKIFISNKT